MIETISENKLNFSNVDSIKDYEDVRNRRERDCYLYDNRRRADAILRNNSYSSEKKKRSTSFWDTLNPWKKNDKENFPEKVHPYLKNDNYENFNCSKINVKNVKFNDGQLKKINDWLNDSMKCEMYTKDKNDQTLIPLNINISNILPKRQKQRSSTSDWSNCKFN